MVGLYRSIVSGGVGPLGNRHGGRLRLHSKNNERNEKYRLKYRVKKGWSGRPPSTAPESRISHGDGEVFPNHQSLPL